MGIDADDVKIVVNAGLQCIKKTCIQCARNHPFISGVLLLFLFLHIFFPYLFNLLFYSSPFLIGLAFYFGGGQLSFSHLSIKNNDDERTHGTSLAHGHLRKEEAKDHGVLVASEGHQDKKEDAKNHGMSARDISLTLSGSNSWQRVRKPIQAEMSRRTFKRKDKMAFLKEDEIVSRALSFRDEFFGSLLNEMPMKLKEEESRATGMNLIEESLSLNNADDTEVKKNDAVDRGHVMQKPGGQDEVQNLVQKHDVQDEVQNLKPLIPNLSASASDSEEETHEERNKVVEWTEDDQRNLMDLGISEIERNRRLESLIAKRRARKLLSMQPQRTPLNSDQSILSPISTLRTLDDAADCQPGSAPSILLPSRNPFDLPYDPSEEKPVLTGGSFEEEFFNTHHKDICMCRHESFNRGPSYMEQLNGEPVTKALPAFLTKPRTERPGYSRFRRESDAEDNMSRICDELEKEALFNGAKSDSQVLRRPSLPVASAAENAKEVEGRKQDKVEDNANITTEEKGNAVNKECRRDTRVRPRMVEDDSSDESSSSSSSAVAESVFDASKNEAFRNSVRKVLTCLVRKNRGTTGKQLIGPAVDSLYDSSPTAFQRSKMEERSYYTSNPFHTHSYSIASDMNVEVSEAGSPTYNMETSSPPTDRESLVYDGDVDKDINSGDEELWGASPHPVASEEYASRFRVNELGEFSRSPLGIPYSSSSNIDFMRPTKGQPFVDLGFPPTPRVIFPEGRKARVTGYDYQMNDENQQVITDDASESRSSVSSSSDVVQGTLEHLRHDSKTLSVGDIGSGTAEHQDSHDPQECSGGSKNPIREEATDTVALNLIGENHKSITVNGFVHDSGEHHGFKVENSGDIQSSYNKAPPSMQVEPSVDRAPKSILPETEATSANCTLDISNGILYSLGSAVGKGSVDNQQQQNKEQSGDNMNREEKQSEATVTNQSEHNHKETCQEESASLEKAAAEADSSARKQLPHEEEERKGIKLVDSDVSNLNSSNRQESAENISSFEGGTRNRLDEYMGSQDAESASDNSTAGQICGNSVTPHDVQDQQFISQVADSRDTNSSHDLVAPATLTETVVEQVPSDRSSSPKSVLHETVPMDENTSTKNDQNIIDSNLMMATEGQSDDETESRSQEEMESETSLQPSHTATENKDIMENTKKSISSEVTSEDDPTMQGQSLDEERKEVKSIEGNRHDSHCSTSQESDANRSRSLDVVPEAREDSILEKPTIAVNSLKRGHLVNVEEGKENESIGQMVSNATGSTSQEAVANLSSSVDEDNTEVDKEAGISNSLTEINHATTIHEESEFLKKATVEANIDETERALVHEQMPRDDKLIEEGTNDPNCLMNQKDQRSMEETQDSPNGDINTRVQLQPSNSTQENDEYNNNATKQISIAKTWHVVLDNIVQEASSTSENGVTEVGDITDGNELSINGGNDFRRELMNGPQPEIKQENMVKSSTLEELQAQPPIKDHEITVEHLAS